MSSQCNCKRAGTFSPNKEQALIYRILLTITLTLWAAILLMIKTEVPLWYRLFFFAWICGTAALGWGAAEEHAATKRHTP